VARTLLLLFFAGVVFAQTAPNRAVEREKIGSTLFVPNPLPPLAVETYGEFQPAPGVIAERVSYATAYGLRVPAILYRPAVRPAGKMPGIVVVDGHGGDKYSWYSFYTGLLYAQAGAAVLTYDPIGEGERNAERKNDTASTTATSTRRRWRAAWAASWLPT
jgi:dipeptidyl aminopeptidase/acylaminoacyl peptidase